VDTFSTETRPLPQKPSSLPTEDEAGRPARFDWEAVWAWLLGFGLVVYLGLKGGGFDPLLYDQVGIAAWWICLAGVAVGALPRRRPEPLAWVALGLLAAFAIWTALSLGWTESADKTSAELARVTTYLGVFALALLSRGRRGARRMVAAVGFGIAVVGIVGLLSRLHPDWFPAAENLGNFLGEGARERLSYPINYWNGLAALIAIGLPALVQVASSARFIPARVLAAAAIPALALTSFFTLSRGGIAAAILGVGVYLALTSDRLPKILTLIPAAAGGAILVAAAESRDALQEGLLNSTASQQGDEMLTMTILVCLAAGAVQLLAALLARGVSRPSWTVVPREAAIAATVVGVVAVVVAALALGAPGKLSDGWDEFKGEAGPGEGSARLTSAAGERRYQLWESALDENATEPLSGTGSGTFEFWWGRKGEGSVVLDAHSLYLQTLGELGIVGMVLLGGFMIAVLAGGVLRLLAADPHGRGQLAAALAGCVAFSATAAVDWMWQIPVLPVSVLLLASVLLTAGLRRRVRRGSGLRALPPPWRMAFAAVSLVAIVAIAIPLASTSLVRTSEADAREGDLTAALESARSAQNAQPGAAAPRLQEALVLEALGDLDEAAVAAREATDREKTNWRNWLTLSRIEAERGRAPEAVRAYERAASLNHHSLLFPQGP
jgi:hypothetical protein